MTSSSNKKVRLSDESYLMISLHASKYPSEPVLGFLVGAQGEDQVQYDVSCILPVCHAVPAGPLLEIAAEVAERSLCQGVNKIVGIYYALEYDNKGAPPPYIERIIANLKHILGPQALVVQFRNNLLSQSKALFVEALLAGGPLMKCETISSASYVNEKFAALISANKQLMLIDVEDHMNTDLQSNFLNPELISLLR